MLERRPSVLVPAWTTALIAAGLPRPTVPEHSLLCRRPGRYPVDYQLLGSDLASIRVHLGPLRRCRYRYLGRSRRSRLGPRHCQRSGRPPHFSWTGTTWKQIQGGAVHTAVAPDSSPALVNSAHQIFPADQKRTLAAGTADSCSFGQPGSGPCIRGTLATGALGHRYWTRIGLRQVGEGPTRPARNKMAGQGTRAYARLHRGRPRSSLRRFEGNMSLLP
jgi:hypothetical protein